MLRELREPLWVYLDCPSFLSRDCNACFTQIFEERTFGDLSSEEMNIFSTKIRESLSHFVRPAMTM